MDCEIDQVGGVFVFYARHNVCPILYIHIYLLPCEWEDQSNPVLCIY